MNNTQFEINFAPQSDNHFRETLDRGGFVFLVEHNSAGRDNDLDAAKERLRKLESAVLDIKSLDCALAITDAYSEQDSYRSLDYAMGLDMTTRDLNSAVTEETASCRLEFESAPLGGFKLIG